MPGAGRPGDPLWFAAGFVICVIPGIYFHQVGLGLALGIVVGGALGLIREDRRRGYHRPVDPLWFCLGLLVGVSAGVGLHFLGLTWRLGLGLGFALGLFLGAVAGTIRAERDSEDSARTGIWPDAIAIEEPLLPVSRCITSVTPPADKKFIK